MSVAAAGRDVVQHIADLDAAPIIVGHSFGGLFSEKLLGQGLGAAGVAIDPAQIKGVLPLPLAQVRAGLPGLGNPANLHKADSLTEKESRFGFGNAVSEEESLALYEKWTIPHPRGPCSKTPRRTSFCTPKPRSTPRTTLAVRRC
ncbi:MAG TPA: alpha/beta hydrolase [Sporichthyaceae bacterium]|nr:alpha/beta hydrolase [Sporichthyaceae bacterium]